MSIRHVAVAGLVATALVLSACGGSSSDEAADSDASKDRTELQVGLGRGVFQAPMKTAAFADAGFDLTEKEVTSGAVAVPLLLNGQLQFSEADTVGALTAISKGVPLTIVGAVTSTAATPEKDSQAILVAKKSTSATAADLNGKKLGVNAIGGAAQIAAAAAIDKLGGDSASIKFVELPPNSMVESTKKGTVDAVVTSRSDSEAEGLKSIIAPTAEGMPSAPLIVWITSKKYAADNPEIVKRFAAAAKAANQQLVDDPELVRKVTVDSATVDVSPELAKKLVLAQFEPTTVQADRLQTVVDLMVKYKVIKESIDASTVLAGSR